MDEQRVSEIEELEKEAAEKTTAPIIAKQLQEIAAQLLSISKLITKKF